MIRKLLAGMAAFLFILALPAATAETVTLTGTVVNTKEEFLVSAYGGTIDQIFSAAGDTVHSGDVIASLRTRKVYALQDGIVHYFGEPGESAEMITEKYGAVAYVEPFERYTVSVSTKNADTSNEENLLIHPGETVYLRVTDDQKRTGSGIVTTVSGSSFTVIVLEGSFKSGSSVYVYRDPAFTFNTRLGKGSITVQDPVVYTGDGIVTAYNAKDGDSVKKGDVLFELIEGSYTGPLPVRPEITAPCDGIIASMNISRETAVQAGETVAILYPDDFIRIEAYVSETDLHFISAGQNVLIGFTYLDNGDLSVPGIVEKISPLGENSVEGSEEAWFCVTVKPEKTDGFFYGAHVFLWTEQTGEGN